MSKSNKIRYLIPQRIKNLLKDIYYFGFRRKLKYSHQIYKYSDEHLKFTHILEAVNYLRIAGNHGKLIPQTYFEFGCHSGRTFTTAINCADYLKMSKMEFFAFDSFEGLPTTNSDYDGSFKEGTFRTNIKDFKRIIERKTYHNLYDSNIISGYYDKSLTEELQNKLPKIGVVHIDVDLYSSTVEVLKFIKPLLYNGSIILFDDWYCFPAGKIMGEERAFQEFLVENKNIKVKEWKNYSTFGKSFFVTSIN